jgi:hypothetical protein
MNASHRYGICDLVLTSNIALPELPPANVSDQECQFELLPAGVPLTDRVEWFHEWKILDDGGADDGAEQEAPWLQLGRCRDDYVLRFPAYGEFIIAKGANSIQCRPLPETAEMTVRHLLLDQVMPLVLSRWERLVLHASAILTRCGAIAFVGNSGKGKSTLATSFALEGFSLLSDDYLVLRLGHEGWKAMPAYPGVRLWPSTAEALLPQSLPTTDVAPYTAKRRVADPKLLPQTAKPALLRKLYLLAEEASGISIERVSPGRSIISLVEFAYNLDITDSTFLRQQFETVNQVAREVPVYAIHFPRDYSTLPALREAILPHLQEDNDIDTAR